MWERSVIAEEGFELCYLDDSWGYIIYSRRMF